MCGDAVIFTEQRYTYKAIAVIMTRIENYPDTGLSIRNSAPFPLITHGKFV